MVWRLPGLVCVLLLGHRGPCIMLSIIAASFQNHREIETQQHFAYQGAPTPRREFSVVGLANREKDT